jgi:hypothetical protein
VTGVLLTLLSSALKRNGTVAFRAAEAGQTQAVKGGSIAGTRSRYPDL